MPIRADTSDEEVDTSERLDHLFVSLALSGSVFSQAIEEVCILRVDVDMVEEVALHKVVIALGVRRL